jgi:hypothetical protein
MTNPASNVDVFKVVRELSAEREKATVTAPGRRWVPVTMADFEEVFGPLGFVRDLEASAKSNQYVLSKPHRYDSLVYIRIYTSIPTYPGAEARLVGEDSIKVSVVRMEEGRTRPLIKKLPYACRTRGWRTVLLDKIEEQMRRFGRAACPDCGAATIEREGKYGAFYGCVRFPDCKGIVK